MEKNSLHFDPNCKDCRHRIRVGKNGVSLTTNLVLWISSNDYYSFQLRVPQVVTLTYNLSVEIKQVDVDALNGTILETIISDDQTTGKSVGLQTGQECLFADIVYNSNVTHDYTFLEVSVEPRLDAGIGMKSTWKCITLATVNYGGSNHLCPHSFAHTCSILLLLQQSEKQLTLTTLFQQPMATSYTTFTGACAALTSPAILILTPLYHNYRQTSPHA